LGEALFEQEYRDYMRRGGFDNQLIRKTVPRWVHF
jgi:hypothetical protein